MFLFSSLQLANRQKYLTEKRLRVRHCKISAFVHFSHCGASFFWSEHNVSLLRRYGTSLSESEGSKPGRRHSHSIVSMTESDSPPQLPSPTRPLHLSSGKAPLTNVGEFACSIVQTHSKNTFCLSLSTNEAGGLWWAIHLISDFWWQGS